MDPVLLLAPKIPWAFVVFILLLLPVAAIAAFLKSPKGKGLVGEWVVNLTTKLFLDKKTYHLAKNVTLPTDEGTTQIDHVIVSRYGIFVIETKNMGGAIYGTERDAQWTQAFGRNKNRFQNPLRQNYHHVKVVQDLLGIRLDQLENLVAFVGSAEPKTEMPANVFWNRRDLFNYIASRKTVRFTENEVREFARKLRSSALDANKETRRAHVQHLREKAIQKETDLTKCPRCGSKMIERTNKKTGQTFYGCSRYPKCRGTRQVK